MSFAETAECSSLVWFFKQIRSISLVLWSIFCTVHTLLGLLPPWSFPRKTYQHEQTSSRKELIEIFINYHNVCIWFGI